MSLRVPGFKPGVFIAGASLVAARGLAVKIDANGDLVLAGDGELSAGILADNHADNEACELEMDGIIEAVSGAAFGENVKLAANAAGKLITAASGKHVVAVSLQPAAGADELVGVKVVGLSGQLLA